MHDTPTSENTATASLNLRRRKAVEMRLQGLPLATIRVEVNLSNPTIINAHKAFLAGGWEAVDRKPRGRSAGGVALGVDEDALLDELLAMLPEALDPAESLWSYRMVRHWLAEKHQRNVSLRTATKYAERWQLNGQSALTAVADTTDKQTIDAAKNRGLAIFSIGTKRLSANTILFAHDTKGSFTWLVFQGTATADNIQDFLGRLLLQAGKPFLLLVSGFDLSNQPQISNWFVANDCEFMQPKLQANQLNSDLKSNPAEKPALQSNTGARPEGTNRAKSQARSLTHLARLEAESIHILREVIAEADKPVMLFSMGKDSAVMLHLARKAFFPAPLPLPLLHIDTTWKFKAVYDYRKTLAKDPAYELIVHINQQGLEQGVNPITHGSALHTDIMKTESLKQALGKHEFDVAITGARRDEERSRAKERVFSFRNSQHHWDPRNQRPELWNLFNTRKNAGESIRAFPLSNWTEADIWQYIDSENIDVVPLYYAAERPVIERDGKLVLVDDERLPLNSGEVPTLRCVRFRTLGCYPLTGACESTATTAREIVTETLSTHTSERVGRMIDHDNAVSMEKKKQEGYF